MSTGVAVSLGTQALLLICLEARQGEWVSVDDLAQTFGLRPGQVEDGLVALWDAGHVRLDRVGGQLVRAKALVRS